MAGSHKVISSVQATGPMKDWPHLSTQHFLGTYGRIFKFEPKPHTVGWGTPKHCYANAAELVISRPRRFVYCEGLAVGVIPVDHAWVYDLREKQMIDHTWRHVDGAAYIGVGFTFQYLRKVIIERETYGPLIDNWGAQWPLLSGKDKDFLHPALPPQGLLEHMK